MSGKVENLLEKKKMEMTLKELNSEIINSNFSLWFANSIFYIKNNQILISLKNEFAINFIQHNYLEELQKITDLEIKLLNNKKIKKFDSKLIFKDLDEITKNIENQSSDKQKEKNINQDKVKTNKEIKDELANKKRNRSFDTDEVPQDLKEIDVDNVLRDIDKSMFSASIPRSVYLNIIQQDFDDLETAYNKGKLTKVDLLVYIALCFRVNSTNGLVKNTSSTQIANFIKHSSHSKVVQSLKKLENLDLIKINRTIRPYQYKIIGYEAASKSNSKGYVNITYKLFEQLTNACLRQIRGVLWLLNHRYHLENKLIQYTPNLGKLKKVMNARCFREALNLLSKLEGSIFKLVDKLKNVKRLEFYDKFRSKVDLLLKSDELNSVFDKEKLGIGNIIQPSKEILSSVYDSLKNVDIPITQDNIRKAIGLASLIPKEIVYKAQQICNQKDVRSDHKTISFYTGLLQKLYNE